MTTGSATSGSGESENPKCVSGIAALDWDIDDELAMYSRLPLDSVGLAWLKIREHGARRMERLLARSGLDVAYLVYPMSADPDDRETCSADEHALAAAIDFAAAIGARLVYLTSGQSGALTWEEAADRFTVRLAPLVDRAADAGVRLAIENTSPVLCGMSFTHTARDAFELAGRIGAGVCLDLYCAWQERDLRSTVSTGIDALDLVQVSDFRVGTRQFPNRWVPGDGDLPLSRLLGTVIDAGYRGIVDLELCGPAIDEAGAEASLRRGLAWITRRLTG